MKLIVTGLFVSSLAIAPAFAQTSSEGSVRGRALDEQGAVLPGVSITATSPDVGGRYSTISDGVGEYRLLNLPPGQYTIAAELPGFAKFVRDNIVVRAGLNLSVDIVLNVGAVSDTVEVKADTPMLESSKAVQAVNISGEFQRALPLSVRRNWSDFMLLTPGVGHIDDPGQGYFYYVHGAQLDSNVIQLDGADVLSAQQSATAYLNLNHDAIADVQVKTGGIDAASPLGMGGSIVIASQSGTNQLKGAGTFVFQPKSWNADNNPGGTTTAIHTIQPDISMGGPIVRNRWWFFTSYRFAHDGFGLSRRPDQIADLRALVPGFEPFDREGDKHYLFLKTTTQISPNHQAYAFYQYDDFENSSAGATSAGNFGFSHIGGAAASARLSSLWGSSLTTRLLATWNNKRVSSELKRFDLPSISVHRGVFLSAGRLMGTGSIATLQNSQSGLEEPFTKITLSADASYYHRGAIGAHELQAGVYLQPWIDVRYITGYTNGGYVLEETVLRDSANPAAGMLPFHRVVYDRDRFTSLQVDNRDYAFYVQDAWKPTPRLTINAGIRVDMIKRTDKLFDTVMQDTTAVGPRLGVNFMVTADGRNVVRANWGRIHETAARGTTTTAGTVRPGVRDLYDLDLNGTFETALETPPTTLLTLNREIDVEGYHQPHNDEWIVGYQRQLPGQITVDASLMERQFRDRIASVEINSVYDGDVFVGYANEAFNEIFRLTSNVWNWPVYRFLEFQVAKRSSRLQLLASYMRTFQRLRGTWQPGDYAAIIQPDAFPNDRGIGSPTSTGSNSLSGTDQINSETSRTHTVSAAVTYQGPWHLLLATSVQFQSGVWSGPIVTRIAAPDPRFGPPLVTLSNGRVVSNPLATTIRFAYPTRGDEQILTPAMKIWNARVGREFTLGGVRLEGAVDVLNLLNDDADQLFDSGGNQQYSPNFGKGRWRVQPRGVQISGRIVF